MSHSLVTVEQAAEQLRIHPKTVLRYIRDGRLPATRIGKSYRIVRAALDAFAGVASDRVDTVTGARTTCIVDIPQISATAAERVATLLNSVAMARQADASPIHLETVFDPLVKSLKVVVIGSPSDAARLLEMLQVKLDSL